MEASVVYLAGAMPWSAVAARRLQPASIMTTVAGNGTSGPAGDGGPATSAELSAPAAVALDASGNLFIADSVRTVWWSTLLFIV